MNKHLILSLAVAGTLAMASAAWANGTAAGDAVSEGVEISGAVDVVTGWQHDDQDATLTGGGLGGMIGYGVPANAANADHFRFVINQVELDIDKSFGENIALRADIDFEDLANTGQAVANIMDLEQAYVTANLAAGNGVEFLIGKFNAPVGVELEDTRDMWFISYAPPYRYMTPAHSLGVKTYYAFSDLVDFHLAVVNSLNNGNFATNSALPSGIFRIGFNWGDEGNESTVGVSGGFGPEATVGSAGVAGAVGNTHFDFFGDMDLLIAATDTVSIMGEGVYRQSNSETGGANQKAIAGLLALNYAASDVWDVSVRAGGLWEINPRNARGSSGASTTGGTWMGTDPFPLLPASLALTGDGVLYSGTLGTGYAIADGAKMKVEYRFDWFKTSGNNTNNDAQSLMAQFAYSF